MRNWQRRPWPASCRPPHGDVDGVLLLRNWSHSPNTYYVKAHPFSLSIFDIGVALRAIAQHGITYSITVNDGIGIFCVLCLKKREHAWPPLLFLVAAPLIYAVCVVATRPVHLGGYYWTRWIDPASLLLSASCCVGWGTFIISVPRFTETIADKFGVFRRPMFQVFILTTLFISAVIPTYVTSFSDRRNHMASDSRAIFIINVQMGIFIKENTRQDSVVAVNDADAIRTSGSVKLSTSSA